MPGPHVHGRCQEARTDTGDVGRRCALALALHRAYRRGVDMPVTLLKKDIAAKSSQVRRSRLIRNLRRTTDLLFRQTGIDLDEQ